jgi:plasmid maintenance system antidote protein VapI
LRFFGASPEFWMNLQTRFELATVESNGAAELAKIAPYASS